MTKTRDLANLIADSKVGPTEIDTSGTYTLGGIAATGDLTIDVAGDIILDADGGDIKFKDGGTAFGGIFKSGNDLYLQSDISDGDIKFYGSDGGSGITALTLDMSQAGEANFNSAVKVGGSIVAHQTNKGVLEYNSNIFMLRAYGASAGTGSLQFKTGGGGGSTDSLAMTIDNSGNVGIGATSIDEMLHLEKSSGTTLVKTEVASNSTIGFEIKKTGSTTSNWRIVDGQTVNGKLQIYDVTNSRNIMTFDQSGNVLIGKISSDFDGGVFEAGTGGTYVSRSGMPFGVNRNSSDGSLTNFYKDGAEVGAIGVSGGNNLYISSSQTNHAGLTFATDAILPTRQGATTNGVTDLGATSDRFKDLHLSGTANTYRLRAVTGSSGASAHANADEIVAESNANAGISILSGQSYSGFLHFGDAGVSHDGFIEYYQGDRSMRFGTAAGERARLNADGNLGIGDSDPQEKLTIKGDGARMTISSADMEVAMLGRAGSSGSALDQGYLRLRNQGVTADGVVLSSAGDSWINGGNVGIGTTSPDNPLEVLGADSGIKISAGSSNRPMLRFECGSDEKLILSSNTAYGAIGDGSDANRYIILKDGNVGIKNTDPQRLLHVSMGGSNIAGNGFDSAIFQNNDAVAIRLVDAGDAGSNGGNAGLGNDNGNLNVACAGAMTFATSLGANAALYQGSSTGGTERMRIDNSGNVLIAKNASSIAGVGHELQATGTAWHTKASGNPMALSRKTNDGNVLEVYRDSTLQGVIGAVGTDLCIGTSDTGLRFLDSSNAIIPIDTGTQNTRDDAISFGTASGRYDNIYATNGTINTSDRNEKQNIEELSDAERRVAVAAKSLLRKFKWKSAVASKGDKAQIHFGIIAQDLQTAFAAESLDAGDYGMITSDTWTDDDGNEKTRLGVRYSELLAFIISAI